MPIFATTAKLSNVVLYQPNDILIKRFGNDVGPLAAYIKKIQAVCATGFTGEEKKGVDIVIVLKPGGKSRAWFVSSLDKNPDRTKLKSEIEAIPAPNTQGVVMFALSYDLNGFVRPKPASGKFEPPIPSEWRAKVKDGATPVPDGFIPYVWPD